MNERRGMLRHSITYVRMHIQNFLIAAHYNGATLTVIVDNDECGMITANVASFVLYGPHFCWTKLSFTVDFHIFVIYFHRLTL